MKIFKWITVLFVAISTFSSCSPTKSFTNNQNSILLDYQKSLKTEITNLTNNNLVSTRDCKIWEKDRNDFILMVKEYKDKNEIVRKKSNKAGTAFVITGTVVGVGGGIYGLFSDGDTKGAALTSLIAGSLTGLVGSLNLEKKAERANTCSDFLDGIMLDFAGRWGDTRCPETKQELSDYLSAKDALIESLKSMKCYGLAATN